MKELDLSFNSIPSLQSLFHCLEFNKQVKSLKFNDNPCFGGKDIMHYKERLKNMFGGLDYVNGEQVSSI